MGRGEGWGVRFSRIEHSEGLGRLCLAVSFVFLAPPRDETRLQRPPRGYYTAKPRFPAVSSWPACVWDGGDCPLEGHLLALLPPKPLRRREPSAPARKEGGQIFPEPHLYR